MCSILSTGRIRGSFTEGEIERIVTLHYFYVSVYTLPPEHSVDSWVLTEGEIERIVTL